MPDPLEELYRDIIMDHYASPRGKKRLASYDAKNEGKNPACGDEIELAIKIGQQKIEDISVDCRGCAISVASGSMLAEAVRGKSLPEVKEIAARVKSMLTGEEVTEDTFLGDLAALKGINRFPVRIKCALLAWATLIDCLVAYEQNGQNGNSTGG